jgi:hypothetical protein
MMQSKPLKRRHPLGNSMKRRSHFEEDLHPFKMLNLQLAWV